MASPEGAIAENGALDRITQAGSVRIAVPDNFPPFGDLGPDGKLQGYDIDTATLITDALGVKPELIAVSSVERIPSLTGGKVDLVISNLGKNAERAQAIDFSIAYAPFFSGVFGPARLETAKAADLAGKTIAVTHDTIEDAALTKLAPPTAVIKRYHDNPRFLCICDRAFDSGGIGWIDQKNVDLLLNEILDLIVLFRDIMPRIRVVDLSANRRGDFVHGLFHDGEIRVIQFLK